MKQETGSNNHPTNKIISIRITSGGDNFSIPTISLSADERLKIIIESHKAMLIPTPIIANNPAEEHLLEGGIVINREVEDVVTINHSDQMSALIVVPRTIMQQIDSIYDTRATLSTPLLTTPCCGAGAHVKIHLSKDKKLLCLNIFNAEDLLFAELFEIKGDMDILYWLSRIGEGYDLSEYTIYLDRRDSDLLKLLKRYYKNIDICE